MRVSARGLLWEILFTRFWARLAMLLLSVLATLFALTGPFLQKSFLDRLSGSDTFSWIRVSGLSEIAPTGLLFLAFLSLLAALALNQAVIYLGTKEALWMQRKLAQRLYDHTLRLRTESLHGKTVGEIVSVYTVDIPGATILLEQSLPQGFGILFPLTLGPWVLIEFFQIPARDLVPVLAGVFALNFLLAFRQSRFFFRFKHLAADRVGYVNEWIQNMRTLRILGWIPSFEEKIHRVRKIETSNRISMLNNGQTMNGIASSITFVLNAFLISVLLAEHHDAVTPGTLLALLWIVAIFMTRPFRQMPWFFTFVFDGWTSLKRVADLLALRNTEPLPRAHEFQKLHSLVPENPALRVRGLEFRINGSRLLEDVSFDAGVGEFLAIVGEVGSGKSLLLLSLMGETGATFHEYWIGGNDARKLPLDQLRQFFTFVPQEGFIMSASLRENVVFDYGAGADHDAEVLSSLRRAQFDIAAESSRLSLDTEIGERGVNLSGGQKQRVSLARVDYYDSPVILLDDCLSALDVDTEKKLIEGLLSGPWKDRTRILVTHRLSVLHEVDRILFLENGRIRAEGSFDSLMAKSPEFREYTASLARTEEASVPQKAPDAEPPSTEAGNEFEKPSDSV